MMPFYGLVLYEFVDCETDTDTTWHRLTATLISGLGQRMIIICWRRACAKGLFAGKTGLVGFWCLGTLEELVFI